MDKQSLIGIFVVLSIIPILLVLSYNPEPEREDTLASCNGGRIGQEAESQGIPVQGYVFDIVIPNGECINNVILSKENYTRMQNNVGYFTVKNKMPVTAIPTHNWCPLETWIWDGHQGYYNVTKYQKWMLTEYCNIERNPPKLVHLTDNLTISDNSDIVRVIPEFGTISMLILLISIISVIIINQKYLNKLPRY